MSCTIYGETKGMEEVKILPESNPFTKGGFNYPKIQEKTWMLHSRNMVYPAETRL